MLRSEFRKHPVMFTFVMTMIYIFLFFSIEKYGHHPRPHWIHCDLDDVIPFCKYFALPYFSWHVEMVLVPLALYKKKDMPGLEKTIFTMFAVVFAASAVFVAYPSIIYLRPRNIVGGDLFAQAVRFLYAIDNNRNVCPSLHVIVCVVLMRAVERMDLPKGRYAMFAAWNVLIILSTVFLKQHSVIDVLAGIPFGMLTDTLVCNYLDHHDLIENPEYARKSA